MRTCNWVTRTRVARVGTQLENPSCSWHNSFYPLLSFSVSFSSLWLSVSLSLSLSNLVQFCDIGQRRRKDQNPDSPWAGLHFELVLLVSLLFTIIVISFQSCQFCKVKNYPISNKILSYAFLML